MSDDVRTLADEYYDFKAANAPTAAHMRGDYRFADQFEQMSRPHEDATIAALREFARRAEELDPATMTAAELVTRDVLIYATTSGADVAATRLAELNVDPTFGSHIGIPIFMPRLTVNTPDLADAMVSKVAAMGTYFDEATERLREGLESNRLPVQFAVARVLEQLDELIEHPVDTHPFTVVNSPDSFDDAQESAYRAALATALAESVIPALARQRDVIRDEIAPVARLDEHAGLSWLSDGASTYARAIERFTTLEMQAEEIHQIGRMEIDRLGDEYRAIAGPLLGTTDLAEIFARLREDPELHHENGPDVIEASEVAFERARAEMPNWFNKMPKSDCVVRPIESGPIAFYHPPADDGSRPGMFFMNVADPAAWARYQVEATAYHEGIPGHHLQIAISQELGDTVPRFQREAFISAYGEGWGLYTERLADEMGLYSSELDRVGMLAADSMRASRLVVDTGIHALGWSREEGVEYFANNSPMSLHQIREEVDRYVTMPGQALSYMIGRLEIQRMRRDAEEALGESFDIKAFHDTVLGSGLMPLDTLDRVVRDWVTSQ
jgi:uncharacterized protein (DUF885 family)